MEESLGLIQERIQKRRKELAAAHLRIEAAMENLENAKTDAKALEAGLAKLEEARTALELAAGITYTTTD